MKIICISDTHEKHKKLSLPEGDMLIHAGDATYLGEKQYIESFSAWLNKQPHKYKIWVPGNHDKLFERDEAAGLKALKLYCSDVIYLNDSGIEIEGIKIWGSPVQPPFMSWAFNRDSTEIKKSWDKIPLDTDILITHGPPARRLDKSSPKNYTGYGCPLLLDKVKEVKPKLHVFGHIHGGSGILEKDGTVFINASVLDEAYLLSHYPTEVEYVDNEVSSVYRPSNEEPVESGV